jgi:hypothetical protein
MEMKIAITLLLVAAMVLPALYVIRRRPGAAGQVPSPLRREGVRTPSRSLARPPASTPP